MAYQCQNFKDGQVLTAECLNKIERALEGVCKKEIQAISVNAQNEIIVTFADGSTMNCGKVNVSGGGSGADGITPNIGPNGNWWIGGTDTGVKAAGTNGVDGKDGKTPYIQNGYWYIDGVNTNVKAQGVDGKDGTNGGDGVSPVVTVTSITGGNRITITDKNGTKTVDVMDGADGSNGKDGTNGTNGKDGKGIKSIARTSGTGAAGTTDTYTITYTDNTTSTFTVYNGKNGTNGTNGKDGQNGSDGKDGENGADGQRGTGILKVSTELSSYTTTTGGKNPIKRMKLSTIMDEADVSEVLVGDIISRSYYLYHIYYLDATYAYMDTYTSIRGATGATGADGKDYVLTDADKDEIVSSVVASLGGNPVVGFVDENNNIILSGALPEGTYTLKYEGTEGEYSEIIDLTITAEDKVKYTNVLPLAQEYASENPYVGTDGSVGYGNDMRNSTSSASATYMKSQTGVDTTGLIPVNRGDVIRLKNCNLKVTPSNTSYGTKIQGYNSSKAVVSGFNTLYNNIAARMPTVTSGDEYVEITLEPLAAWTSNDIDNVAFIQISTDGLDETSIITINQEIV